MGINTKTFAGIGSRQTPKSFISKIEELCELLVKQNYVLRSGGADGADTFFENAYNKFNGQKEIYLPWQLFNDNTSKLIGVREESGAFELAEKFHPNWSAVSIPGKKLMARNGFQVLGKDLATPTQMIICWTLEGKEIGGTAQAMRIAHAYNIPIYNLAIEQDIQNLENFLNLDELFAK